MPAGFPVLDHDGPLAFAHRGGAGAWPENTMGAFQGAVDLGYRYLETDVHLTADGVLVAFHDERLDRVTDSSGVISELAYSEVSAALVDGREPIPRFDDLLATFPRARFNIDPKHDHSVEPLAAALIAQGAVDRVCIGAFSDRRLERMRELCGPELCTSLGPRRVGRLLAAVKAPRLAGRPRFVEGAVQVPPAQKGMRIVTERFVEVAHEYGLQVHVWTIDDPDEIHELLDLGVDGVMTDQPAVLRDVLVARDAWVPAPS